MTRETADLRNRRHVDDQAGRLEEAFGMEPGTVQVDYKRGTVEVSANVMARLLDARDAADRVGQAAIAVEGVDHAGVDEIVATETLLKEAAALRRLLQGAS